MVKVEYEVVEFPVGFSGEKMFAIFLQENRDLGRRLTTFSVARDYNQSYGSSRQYHLVFEREE